MTGLAIITGASAGIGAALAPLLAREGWDLLLVARREGQLAETAARVKAAVPGARADVFALDVASPDAAQKLLERAPDARLLVNNAGVGRLGNALDIPIDDYRKMIALNVMAVTELTCAFGKRMVAQGGGTIVNVSSTAAFQSMPYQGVYAATKAYVQSMSEALHYELRRKGVSVLAFCPGPTLTEFGGHAGFSKEVEEAAKAFAQTPEQVAAVLAKAIRRRRERKIPGLMNWLMAVGAMKGPWRLVRWIGAKLFESIARKSGALG